MFFLLKFVYVNIGNSLYCLLHSFLIQRGKNMLIEISIHLIFFSHSFTLSELTTFDDNENLAEHL